MKTRLRGKHIVQHNSAILNRSPLQPDITRPPSRTWMFHLNSSQRHSSSLLPVHRDVADNWKPSHKHITWNHLHHAVLRVVHSIRAHCVRPSRAPCSCLRLVAFQFHHPHLLNLFYIPVFDGTKLILTPSCPIRRRLPPTKFNVVTHVAPSTTALPSSHIVDIGDRSS